MNDNFWTPEKGHVPHPRNSEDDVIDTLPETIFHINASHAAEPSETLRCKICGSTQFHVGSGDYFTAIKCPNCKWECRIHEG